MFEQLAWLLALIPLGLLTWLLCLPGRRMMTLRLLAYIALIFALANPGIKLPGDDGILIVVADRSASVPQEQRAQQEETIRLLAESMSEYHRLGVVSVGSDALVERSPTAGDFDGFVLDANPHGSSLADGIDLARQMVPVGDPARILILSDGLWSGRSPVLSAMQAGSREIPVDTRLAFREGGADLAVDSVHAPATVSEGQGYLISVWVDVPEKGVYPFELRRNGRVIAKGTRELRKGREVLSFRDRPPQAGTAEYRFSITGGKSDPVSQNNSARFLVSVDGKKPLICVSKTPGRGFPALLSASGIHVVSADANQISLDLATLANARGLVLENVAASDLGQATLELIAEWVQQAGGGLMVSGGRRSFGAGGYYESPLDPILPVSMELRQEHRKLAMSIVVVLDRSGSMMAQAKGGKTKMDLANIGTVSVLDLLSSFDHMGVIAVDSAPHIVQDLAPADEVQKHRDRILKIESMGGGIYVYDGLVAAVDMLKKAPTGTRHIILFADGDDAEQPRQYKQLLKQARENGITCSVVALGTPASVDAKFLKDVADRGEGRIFFSDDATALPRLFAQDTFAVARSTFVEQPVAVQFQPGISTVTGTAAPRDPQSVGGYNLCYLRPGAIQGAGTLDEYKAPFIASWPAGTGRALAYTGELNGEFTGGIGSWMGYQPMLVSLARWTAGVESELPDGMVVRSRTIDGRIDMDLYLDPSRENAELANMPELKILRSNGAQTIQDTVPLRWDGVDNLRASLNLMGDETVLPTLVFPDGTVERLPVQCLPYSGEYRAADPDMGRQALRQLAQVSDGQERTRLEGIWDDLPRSERFHSLRPWLLTPAILFFFLEIVERRIGLPKLLPSKKKPIVDDESKEEEGVPKKSDRKAARKTMMPAVDPVVQDTVPPSADARSDDNEDDKTRSALQRARARSKERLRR